MILKQIVIGLGALIGLFLIYKLYTVPHIYKKWAVYNKVRIVVLIIALFFGVIVALMYNLGINHGNSRSATLEIIKGTDLDKIDCLEFYSGSGLQSSSEDANIIVYDDAVISQILKELNELHFVQQSSSSSQSWAVKLSIILENNSLNNIVLDINKINNGDCYFFIMKHTWFGDFNLGLCKDNELGDIIEKTVLFPQ